MININPMIEKSECELIEERITVTNTILKLLKKGNIQNISRATKNYINGYQYINKIEQKYQLLNAPNLKKSIEKYKNILDATYAYINKFLASENFVTSFKMTEKEQIEAEEMLAQIMNNHEHTSKKNKRIYDRKKYKK